MQHGRSRGSSRRGPSAGDDPPEITKPCRQALRPSAAAVVTQYSPSCVFFRLGRFRAFTSMLPPSCASRRRRLLLLPPFDAAGEPLERVLARGHRAGPSPAKETRCRARGEEHSRVRCHELAAFAPQGGVDKASPCSPRRRSHGMLGCGRCLSAYHRRFSPLAGRRRGVPITRAHVIGSTSRPPSDRGVSMRVRSSSGKLPLITELFPGWSAEDESMALDDGAQAPEPPPIPPGKTSPSEKSA